MLFQHPTNTYHAPGTVLHLSPQPQPLPSADANILINQCRVAAQRHLFTYQEPMPCEQLVRLICDMKQGYTQFGGQRPFGVSLLYAGWCASG